MKHAKLIFGYIFAITGCLCGFIVGIQFVFLEINWNYFPTRDYHPGTISGAVDIFYRMIEFFQLLVSPQCLPFIIAGLVCMGISGILLR